MLHECLNIFDKVLKSNGDNMLVDYHVPKAGLYVLVEMNDGGFENWKIVNRLDLRIDKKTKSIIGTEDPDYPFIKKLDYFSGLISTNKFVGGNKKIHSDHFYNFFVKQDTVRNRDVILKAADDYYDKLMHPEKKYKEKKWFLYEEVSAQLPAPDYERTGQIREWLISHIFDEEFRRETDYLRFYFVTEDRDQSLELFKNEHRRYLMPNLFGNESHIQHFDAVYGPPSFGLNFNDKKPYITNLQRKIRTPFMVDVNGVYLEYLFHQYLLMMAKSGKRRLYFRRTPEAIEVMDAGHYPSQPGFMIYLDYSKDVDISRFEVISNRLVETIDFKPVKLVEDKKDELYHEVKKRWELLDLVDSVFFYNRMRGYIQGQEYKIKEPMIFRNLEKYSMPVADWFYRDRDSFEPILERLAFDSIRASIFNGHWDKARSQMNLYFSLDQFLERKEFWMKEDIRDQLKNHILTKERWGFVNDDEAYYAVGQVVKYLADQRSAKRTDLSVMRNLLDRKSPDEMKEELTMMVDKYSHLVDVTKGRGRLGRLLENIFLHDFVGEKYNRMMMIAGFLGENLLYTKVDKTVAETQE